VIGHLEHQVRVPLPAWAEDAPGYVDIDAGIVDLIRALWRRRIETIQSCEGRSPRKAWITFVDEAAARDFIRVVTGKDDAPGWDIYVYVVGGDTAACFAPELIPVACAAVNAAAVDGFDQVDTGPAVR